VSYIEVMGGVSSLFVDAKKDKSHACFLLKRSSSGLHRRCSFSSTRRIWRCPFCWAVWNSGLSRYFRTWPAGRGSGDWTHVWL